MDIQTFIIIILGAITVGGVALFITNKNKERDNPTGREHVTHYMPEQSGGHTEGVAENIETLGNRIRIDFIPRSINYQKEINKNKKLGINKDISVKTYPLFFDKDLVDVDAGRDDHVTIIEAYPQDINQVPKSTQLLKPYILEKINKINMEKDKIKLLNERIKNTNDMAIESFSGKMEKRALSKYSELVDDMKPEQKEEVKKK